MAHPKESDSESDLDPALDLAHEQTDLESDLDGLNDLDVADNYSDAEEDEDPLIGSWTACNDYATSIDIDGIDTSLLELARKEVPMVLDKLQAKIFGTQRKHKKPRKCLSQALPTDFLGAWLDSNLLSFLKSFVNKNLDVNEHASSSDLHAFLRVELMLSFYGVSSTLFFDLEERAHFPAAGQGMSHARYMTILAALSRSGNHRMKSDSMWIAPKAHDRDMADAMAMVRTNSASLGFIAGVTYVGLDDDLLRMRSKKVTAAGFCQTNNPCKGLGVIHHGAVSVATGL
jgi:hypothetical protein